MTGEFSVAVHCLVFLNHKAKTLSSEVLAENVCTNPARIRKVLAKLKKAGLVSTKEGVDGGYLLAENAENITLAMVGDALNVQYVSASWRSGSEDMDCLVASGMASIMDEIYDNMSHRCKVYLEGVTIKDIDTMIFG